MQPIENIVLNDYLYNEIKKMIDDGTLKVGEKILKPELAKRFNVSLTPINGAINRLVGEGYIEQEARKGCSVKGVSKTEICQAFELRAGIEMMAVRLCCEKATDEQLEEIASLFDQFTIPFDESSYKKYVAKDNEFHEKIIKCSGNTLIIQTMDLAAFIARSNRGGLVRPPEQTLAEHRYISDALKARDADEAARRMLEHLLRSRDLIRQSILDEEQKS